MNIKFAISSHINSYEKTYELIVKSLIKSGIPLNDIYFFIGGFDKYEKCENILNINMYYVDHNSMDFTALISVLDLNLESDYWFLLHDTLYVGDNFYNNILNFNHSNYNTIKMTNDSKSMNIGSYKWSYLQSNKFHILSMRNTDYSDNGLQNIKNINVFKEDFIFEDNNIAYNTSIRNVNGPLDFYGNGVDRIVEHFVDIDIFKIKANWLAKPVYEIKI